LLAYYYEKQMLATSKFTLGLNSNSGEWKAGFVRVSKSSSQNQPN
jgi:hypothetical protein